MRTNERRVGDVANYGINRNPFSNRMDRLFHDVQPENLIEPIDTDATNVYDESTVASHMRNGIMIGTEDVCKVNLSSIGDKPDSAMESTTPVRIDVPLRSIQLFQRDATSFEKKISGSSVIITKDSVTLQHNTMKGNDKQTPAAAKKLVSYTSQHVQATPLVRCHGTQTDKFSDVELLKRNVKEKNTEIGELKRNAAIQEAEIEGLRKRVRRTKVDLQTLQDRPADTKFYTGLDDSRVVHTLFSIIRPHMLAPLNLSKEQVFLMTLQKLRFNYFFKNLSISYEVCPATAAKYFFSTIYTIYHVMHNVVHWPERSILKKHTPQCFKDVFGDSVTVIIDCFEIRAEKPSNPIAAAKQWSEYKKSNTLKYLVGISSAGSVIFVSKGYGGRASDKTIAKSSGFLANILEGDVVLADRGFLIDEEVQAKNATLNMPAFRKNGGQLSPVEIENTRRIATVRIHVERAIGQIKEKFKIIKNNVPMSLMLRKHNNVMAMDMIVFVSCILVNMCKPIVN
nr:uncharacterized protein LOC115255548 [Aedes albopictus]